MNPVTMARCLVVLLLALALWDPPLPGRHRTLDIALIQVADDPESKPASALIQELTGTLATANIKVNWYPLTATSAGAGAAVDSARELLPATSTNPMLLVLAPESTTNLNISAGLRRTHSAGIENFWLPTLDASSMAAVRIVSVNAPARIQGLANIPVTVRLAPTRDGSYLVRARLGTASSEQWVSLSGLQPHTLQLWLRPGGGHQQLTVSVHNTQQPQLALAQYHQGITVSAPGPLLLISNHHNQLPGFNPTGRQLLALPPALILSEPEVLQTATTVVLDNIAVDDLSARAWALLSKQVRQRGTSLWALGGDNSFSAGRYRGSALEQLLPVLSEPPLQEPAAAVMFLIDHSGSMGAGSEATVALLQANRAVTEAITMLSATDSIGLVEFADSARTIAPLASGRNRSQLSQLLSQEARGGTRLAAGLQEALEQLLQRPQQQRLLVLVTDGFAAEFDPAPWRARLQDAGITLLALAVGTNPDIAKLEQLAWSEDCQVLRVNQVAQLPRLMASAVATRRNPSGADSAVIQLRSIATASAEYVWPRVTDFQSTRAKPEATQYLVTDTGLPLLASLRAGAGSVLALPAGLYNWAPAWQQWPQLQSVIDDLLSLTAAPDANAALTATIAQRGRAVTVIAESQGVDAGPTAAPMTLTIYGPGSAQSSYDMKAVAPGLHQIAVNDLAAGNMLLQINHGNQELQQAFYQQAVGSMRAAQGEGLLSLWQPRQLNAADIAPQQRSLRQLALIAALLTYLAGLLLESGAVRLPAWGRNR